MKIIFKKIEISDELKENINELKSNKNLEITCFNGHLTTFDKCNVESISPHKILITDHNKNLLILHYAEYMENDKLYFIDGKKEPFTIQELKKFVKKYF